jgi:predicted nucleotidyltransferase
MTLEEIRKKHNLSLILIHGSQVTGKIHAKSDTDIAVMQKDGGKDLDLFSLYGNFAKIFKTDKIDIVNLTRANPLLLFTVARKSKLLAGSQKDYDKFKLLAFHKYSDYQPYFKMESDFIKERITAYA